MNRPSSERLFPPKALVFVPGVFVLFCLASLRETVPRFWSADNGIKWWQAQTISEKGPRGAELDYEESDIDPEGRYEPLRWKYGRYQDGKIRFSYPPFYAMLLSPLAAGDRFRNALWLSALFAAVLFLLIETLGRTIGVCYSRLSAGMAVCLTPIAVYALELNEHLLTLALGLGAWILVLRAGESSRWSFLAAGFLCGLAGWFRNEYLVFGASIAIALGFFKRRWNSLLVLVALVVTLAVGIGLEKVWTPPSSPPLRVI